MSVVGGDGLSRQEAFQIMNQKDSGFQLTVNLSLKMTSLHSLIWRRPLKLRHLYELHFWPYILVVVVESAVFTESNEDSDSSKISMSLISSQCSTVDHPQSGHVTWQDCPHLHQTTHQSYYSMYSISCTTIVMPSCLCSTKWKHTDLKRYIKKTLLLKGSGRKCTKYQKYIVLYCVWQQSTPDLLENQLIQNIFELL